MKKGEKINREDEKVEREGEEESRENEGRNRVWGDEREWIDEEIHRRNRKKNERKN